MAALHLIARRAGHSRRGALDPFRSASSLRAHLLGATRVVSEHVDRHMHDLLSDIATVQNKTIDWLEYRIECSLDPVGGGCHGGGATGSR